GSLFQTLKYQGQILVFRHFEMMLPRVVALSCSSRVGHTKAATVGILVCVGEAEHTLPVVGDVVGARQAIGLLPGERTGPHRIGARIIGAIHVAVECRKTYMMAGLPCVPQRAGQGMLAV